MDLETLRRYRPQILASAGKNNLDNIRVFGSVARGEAGPESDVDFLVHCLPQASLVDLGGFIGEMESLLSTKIDVATDGKLHWVIRDRILQEAVPL